MKIVADHSKCMSYGNCVAAADELFDLDDDGLVIVLDEEPAPELHEKARRAATMCPTKAITLDE